MVPLKWELVFSIRHWSCRTIMFQALSEFLQSTDRRGKYTTIKNQHQEKFLKKIIYLENTNYLQRVVFETLKVFELLEDSTKRCLDLQTASFIKPYRNPVWNLTEFVRFYEMGDIFVLCIEQLSHNNTDYHSFLKNIHTLSQTHTSCRRNCREWRFILKL